MNRHQLRPASPVSSSEHFRGARVVSARPVQPWTTILIGAEGEGPPMSLDRLCQHYRCVIFTATDKPLRDWTEGYATENEALSAAAREVFMEDDAAGYELWCEGRRIARFLKP